MKLESNAFSASGMIPPIGPALGAVKDQIEAAMEGHILDTAELLERYSRQGQA